MTKQKHVVPEHTTKTPCAPPLETMVEGIKSTADLALKPQTFKICWNALNTNPEPSNPYTLWTTLSCFESQVLLGLSSAEERQVVICGRSVQVIWLFEGILATLVFF